MFGDTSNNYYTLDGGQDWSNVQQQYGQPVAQQPYGVIHHPLDQQHTHHTMASSTPSNMSLYETVSTSNNNNLPPSLPPMSTFTNRPPQVTPSGYDSNTSSTTIVSSPGVDIKPDMTSLYPSPNSSLDPTSTHQQQSQQQQWSMHRSAPPPPPTALHPYQNDTKLPNEVTHLHSMVRFSSIALLLLFVFQYSYYYYYLFV